MVTKPSLEEFKKIVGLHMKKELDIMEMMYYLDTKDAVAFKEWYINSPYCKGIRELQELVRRGANTGNQKHL
jgi:hypothetical protein